ncbi:hypothetical protein LZ32DRAFT_666174 [Colletotrichum eremochloae]|nr:hypothetical protein LZ32DRAFT_666174 [Colletotrichum eremochloae]
MPKAKPPRYKAHARRVSPFAALTRRIAFGPNVQPPSNFWYPVQGSNVPLQLGAVGGVPQAGPAIIQSVSFLRLPREVRLMIYEHCDSQLILSYQWLHARLSPSTKPGEKKWWTCDICGKEGRVCYCLRPALYTIHPALLDEVHDFVLRKNAFHLEPSAWFDLAKLHDPDRRRWMRVPAELQALWAKFMAGLRRVGVTIQWDSAYLAAVYKALSQSAHQVKELTLFAPIPHRENADWAAYTHFLSRLSGIRSLDTVRIHDGSAASSSEFATSAARKCRCIRDQGGG